jgi:Rps23 Pro-64 3,4-dihydroxylase Tpa1-like proline 4-hydroxylase
MSGPLNAGLAAKMAKSNETIIPIADTDNITKQIGTGINNIKVIENYLTDKESETALSIIKKYKIKEGVNHSYSINNLEEHSPSEEEKLFTNIMRKKLLNTVISEYKMKFIQDRPFMYIVHPTGTYIDPHTDILDIDEPDYENDTYESQIEKYPYLWSGHLSVLAYLNDDYEGGELYFPDFNYSIRPKKNMLILFPGNTHYVHGVSEITSGTRYTISQWTQFSEFNKK